MSTILWFLDRFLVYGIRNLRVADGSIMPEVPATHPNSVIFMIGERAADMIKKTWGSY
jgi:choline dehydrogenase-like flavoprotein